MTKLLKWYIYEITSNSSSLNGVKLRGRIRKFGIENGFNVLAENTTDIENGVRFAVLNSDDADKVTDYLHSIINDVSVKLVRSDIENPVLSHMKVIVAERYKL